MARIDPRRPWTRADWLRINTVAQGFFFWGMMLDVMQ